MMIFKNKVMILSSIIAVLIITYFLGGVFSSKTVTDRHSMEPVFDIGLKSQVDGIRVSIDGGILNLEKSGGKWVAKVGEGVIYPAAERRISGLLDSIFDVTKYKLMGHGEKYWSEFELEDEKAFRVELSKEGVSLFTLFIGKLGPGHRGDYVRSTLSDEIYLTDATMRRHFGMSPQYWFDLKLFRKDYKGEDIFAINITNNKTGEKISLKKDKPDAEGHWENLVEGGSVLDKDGADLFVRNIAKLEGVNFVSNSEIKSEFVMEIDSASYGHLIFNGQKIRNKDGFIYALKRKGDPYSYLILESDIDNILTPDYLYKAE